MLPPRLGSALGASGLPVHLWGQGQQMSVLQCHRELWLVRGTSWRRALGSVRDRWLCQIWLPEIVQDMRHLAGLQRPGLPGWPQGPAQWGPERTEGGGPLPACPLHHPLYGFMGGLLGGPYCLTIVLTMTREAFHHLPAPHSGLISLHSSPAGLSPSQAHQSCGYPGPLHLLHPLPGPLFLLLSVWLASSPPVRSFLHRYLLREAFPNHPIQHSRLQLDNFLPPFQALFSSFTCVANMLSYLFSLCLP